MFYKSMDKVKNMIQKNIQNILTPAPVFTYLACVPTHVCTMPLMGSAGQPVTAQLSPSGSFYLAVELKLQAWQLMLLILSGMSTSWRKARQEGICYGQSLFNTQYVLH